MTYRIDLVSDTVTRPDAAMRAAMASAEVGDEQREGDPTADRLCAEVAEMLGKEAAVFLPSIHFPPRLRSTAPLVSHLNLAGEERLLSSYREPERRLLIEESPRFAYTPRDGTHAFKL